MPFLSVPSTSHRSLVLPEMKSVQLLQYPHGFVCSVDMQFKADAKILAVDVFPVPRGPWKR
uniref:Protein STICHEL n=1 Tax=Rhizophora mucronata TaxID=61149 RepID=A0A2P2JUB9_RHIMU